MQNEEKGGFRGFRGVYCGVVRGDQAGRQESNKQKPSDIFVMRKGNRRNPSVHNESPAVCVCLCVWNTAPHGPAPHKLPPQMMSCDYTHKYAIRLSTFGRGVGWGGC